MTYKELMSWLSAGYNLAWISLLLLGLILFFGMKFRKRLMKLIGGWGMAFSAASILCLEHIISAEQIFHS